MLQKEYKIYRLVLDGKTVYVGYTVYKRLNDRKSVHNNKNTFERVKESTIELIEITTDKTREQFWIEHYLNEGCILFNKRRGATGLSRKEYEKTEEYKQYQKEYREENSEKLKEYLKEYNKDWYQKNKKHQKELGKEWYQKNKKQKLASNKKYQQENKEKINEQRRVRRAKKKLEKQQNI
jgi:hypothetical protein